MITYVYLVKCPNCDDEYFDFFKEAEAYALGKLSEKPIITQTEVTRNDFGECTDHCDLGTVWSWEDVMGKETDAEPTVSVFTKDDLKLMANGEDPEFDNLDNSVDYEIEEISDRKPIPEGMTIEELVEAMEENEDTVECTKCGGLFEKASCTHNKEGFGWCCTNCEAPDTLVEETEYDLAMLVKDSINHLTNDLGKDPWADDFADDVISDLENNYGLETPESITKYNDWASSVACEVSRQLNNQLSEEVEELHDLGNTFDGAYPEVAPEDIELEEAISGETVDLVYDNLSITLQGPKRDVDDWDEVDYEDSYTYTLSKDDVATTIWENFITEEDVTDIPGGLEALEDDAAWSAFLETHFDTLFDKYYTQLLDHYREAAEKDFEDNYSYYDYRGDLASDYGDWQDHAQRDEF